MSPILSIAIVSLFAASLEPVELPRWSPLKRQSIEASLFPISAKADMTSADGPGCAYEPATGNGGMKTPLSGDEASNAPALTHKVATATAAHGVGVGDSRRDGKPGCPKKVRLKATVGDGTPQLGVTAGETASNMSVARGKRIGLVTPQSPSEHCDSGRPGALANFAYLIRPVSGSNHDDGNALRAHIERNWYRELADSVKGLRNPIGGNFADSDTKSPVRGEPRAGRMAIAQVVTKTVKTAAAFETIALRGSVPPSHICKPCLASRADGNLSHPARIERGESPRRAFHIVPSMNTGRMGIHLAGGGTDSAMTGSDAESVSVAVVPRFLPASRRLPHFLQAAALTVKPAECGPEQGNGHPINWKPVQFRPACDL